MTIQTHLERLLRQRSQISALKDQAEGSSSAPFKKWRRDTEVAIEKTFGRGTRHSEDFGAISYFPYALSTATTNADIHRRYVEGLEEADAVLLSIIEELEEYGLESPERPVMASDPLVVLEKIFDRFHLVARQLRVRHNARATLDIEDEYDVQDLLHAILKIDFDDVRPEEWSPSYAGSASRMDFLLKVERLVVEVKKTRKGLGPREVGEQLVIDIAKYRAHPDCTSLVCFVYDPDGRIGNPSALETDLHEDRDGFRVRVFIRPRGL